MERRRLLAVLAVVVLLAGCIESEDQTETADAAAPSDDPDDQMTSAPVHIYPLVWIGMILPVVLAVAAGVHHEVFRRRRVPSQDADWSRMLGTYITLTTSYFGFFLLWLFVDGWELMGTIPVSANGILFWAGVAMASVLFGVHWGVGSMRRRQATHIRYREELERRNIQLERSNKELEQFAFLAAHDLQEPLRKVVGYTNLLKHRYADQIDDRATSYVDQASRQVDRMRRLISDMLSFSRIGTGAAMETVDLDAIYQEIQHDLPKELASTGVTFSGDHLGAAYGNRALVRQILENLIGNAIKYHRPGTPPHVHVATAPAVGGVQVRVEDNGVGIAPAYRQRIFSLFERLQGNESAFEGTGIGLAVCKKAVEAHGGRIWVESTPGEGSTFFFVLPHRERR